MEALFRLTQAKNNSILETVQEEEAGGGKTVGDWQQQNVFTFNKWRQFPPRAAKACTDGGNH